MCRQIKATLSGEIELTAVSDCQLVFFFYLVFGKRTAVYNSLFHVIEGHEIEFLHFRVCPLAQRGKKKTGSLPVRR